MRINPHHMKVRFTQKADADNIDSYWYGIVNFGRERADRYEQGLRQVIDIIANNPRLAAERLEFVSRPDRQYFVNLAIFTRARRR